MSLIDIGANLLSDQFREDVDSVVQYAKSESGVDHIVITVSKLRQLPATLRLCEQYGDRWMTCTVGIHPHDAKSFNTNSVQVIREALSSNKKYVKAIGETGLDYNRMFSSQEQQLRSFRAHVVLACELQVPLFLHEREAHDDFVRVLDEFAGDLPNVVVHCFTGNRRELEAYLRRGFYIGLTGFVDMAERGRRVRELVASIPLNKLLLESDSPWMIGDSGHAYLAKPGRNEPATVKSVVQCIARLLNVRYEIVANATTNNARDFFRLGY